MLFDKVTSEHIRKGIKALVAKFDFDYPEDKLIYLSKEIIE